MIDPEESLVFFFFVAMIALDYLNNEFVVSSCTLEGAIFLFTTLMEKKMIHFTKKRDA